MATTEAVNQPDPPGLAQYKYIMAKSDQATAETWKAQAQRELIEKHGYGPQDVDAYFGDQQQHDQALADHVATNMQRSGAAGQAPGAQDPVKAFEAGFGASDIGLGMAFANHEDLDAKVQAAQGAPGSGFVDSVARASGQMVGDIPASVAGFFAGLGVGAAGGTAVAPGVGTAVGGVIGSGFGAGAAPQAIRESLMAAYHSGNIKTAQDAVNVISGAVLNTLKAGGVGAVSNVVGGAVAGKVAAAGAGELVSAVSGTAANAAAGATTGAALEGKLPSKDEFLAAGAAALVMHGLGSAAGTFKNGVFTPTKETLQVQANLEEIYRRTGIAPRDAVAQSNQDPAIRGEIFGQDVNGEPNLSKIRQYAPNEPPKAAEHPGNTSTIGPAKPATEPTETGVSMKPASDVDRFLGLSTRLEGSGDAAISPKGAVGRHQIMPGTARQYMGPDYDVSKLMDPAENLKVATTIARDLTRRYPGDEVAQLVAYNAGPGRANQLVTKGAGTRLEASLDPTVRGGVRYEQVPSDRDESFLPLETQRYIANARRIASGQVTEGQGGPPEGNFPDPNIHAPAVQEALAGAGGGNPPPPSEPLRVGGPPPSEPLRVGGPPPSEPLRVGGPPPEERPEVNWWKDAPRESLEDEILSNVGEPPEKAKVPFATQVGRIFSELSPARNIDNALIDAGLLDRSREFGVEDGFRQTYASSARAGVFSRYGAIDPITLEIKRSSATDVMAMKALKRDGGDINGLKAWMLASRALDLERRGINSGFDPKVVAALRDGTSRASREAQARYGDAFKIMDQVNDHVLDYYRESGMTTLERVAKMKEAAPLGFVSLRRIMGDDASFTAAATRKKFGVVDPLKRMEGSDRKVTDPIIAMLDNRRVMIQMADRNRAIGQLVALAERGATKDIAADLGLMKIEDNHSIAAPGSDVFQPYGIAPEEGAAVFPELLAARSTKLGPNDFIYYRNGQAERWTAKDPAVAELVNTIGTKQEADFAVAVISGMAKIERTGIVLDPSFAPRIMMRHQMTAYVMDPLHPPPYITALKGFLKVLTKDRDVEDLMASGGFGTALVEMDRDHLANDLDNLFEKTGVVEKVTNAFMHPIQFSQGIHEALDLAPRVGYYARAKEMGIEAPKAATMARTAYLDYAERASAQIANDMAKNVPFFRPHMLGLKQAFQSFEQASPTQKAAMVAVKTMQAGFIGIMGPSLILYALNYLADQHLEDGEKYQDIPRWVRDQYYITPPIAGVRLKLKYPPFFGFPMGGFMNRVLDSVAAKDRHAFDNMMSAVLTEYMPPALPTLLTPPLEIITNHSFLSGKTLVPGSVEKASAYLQYTENTTEPAKALAKALGPARWNVPVAKDLSPVDIETLIEGWSGTTGMAALHALNAPFKPVEPDQIANNPFIGSFFVRRNPTSSQGLIDYFNDYKSLQEANADFGIGKKEAESSGDTGTLMDAVRMGSPAYAKLEQGHTAIQTALNVVRSANEDKTMTAEEKRQAVDQIMPQVIQMARNQSELIAEIKSSFKDTK